MALVETAYVWEKEVVDALLALLQKEDLEAASGNKDLWERALLLSRPSRSLFSQEGDPNGSTGGPRVKLKFS